MKQKFRFIPLLMAALAVGCNDNLTDSVVQHGTGDIIHVGGLLTDGGQMVVTQTRASRDTIVRAENVPWMQGALLYGLDITYSNINSEGSHNIDNEKVAILQWTGRRDPKTNRGEYTFKYKGTDDDAEWYDNGPHYFEGQYVPDMIRNGNGKTMDIADLMTNQADDRDFSYDPQTGAASGEIGNYTLLSHYVGMPPNWTASATVDQILLPFKHRLARVIVYVLIDDQLLALDGSPAVLDGYKGGNLTATKDDPSTTSFRFANVKVLDYVAETAAANANSTPTLTPVWGEARRVIPHFCDEFDRCYKSEPNADHPNLRESAVPATEDAKYKDPANQAFLVYTDKRTEKKLHPRESGWLAAHKDFIDKRDNSAYTQQAYHRVPIYDVIVRPTYEKTDDVMYDEKDYYNADKTPNQDAIANLVKETNQIEFEMTLNNGLVYTKVFEFDLNANQQTVVYITIDREHIDYDQSTPDKWVSTSVEDGYYGVNNDLGHNMSIAGSSWQRAVTYTTSEPKLDVTDGNYYDDSRVDEDDLGQYFNDVKQWIEEFAKANMGGARQGDYFVLDANITIDATLLPENFVFSGHLDGRGHTITLTKTGQTVIDEAAWDEPLPTILYRYVAAIYYTDEEVEEYNNTHKDDDDFAPITTEMVKTPAHYEAFPPTSWDEISSGTFYADDQGTPYTAPSTIHHDAVTHQSPSTLFAGLNGTYDGTAGQYNLHNETDKDGVQHLIPVKGYRAELYNTTVAGGALFPDDAMFCGKNLTLDGATVTGYIYNCFDISHEAPNNPISNVVPIPEY